METGRNSPPQQNVRNEETVFTLSLPNPNHNRDVDLRSRLVTARSPRRLIAGQSQEIRNRRALSPSKVVEIAKIKFSAALRNRTPPIYI